MSYKEAWEIWFLAGNHAFINNSVTIKDGKAGFSWTTSTLYRSES